MYLVLTLRLFFTPLPSQVSFIARFMTVFASVIAITKDLPDVEGDKQANIKTFAIKVGVDKIAKGGVTVLALNYVAAIAQGLLSPAGAYNRIAMVVGHSCLLSWLARNWFRTDTEDIRSVKGFYKSIWDLFYAEYALYTLI
jgi:homogentisate solanesyltransferase